MPGADGAQLLDDVGKRVFGRRLLKMAIIERCGNFFNHPIVHWYVPSTKVREVQATHAGEELVAAGEQAGLRRPSLWKRRLRRHLLTTPSQRNTGGVSAPTIRPSAF